MFTGAAAQLQIFLSSEIGLRWSPIFDAPKYLTEAKTNLP